MQGECPHPNFPGLGEIPQTKRPPESTPEAASVSTANVILALRVHLNCLACLLLPHSIYREAERSPRVPPRGAARSICARRLRVDPKRLGGARKDYSYLSEKEIPPGAPERVPSNRRLANFQPTHPSCVDGLRPNERHEVLIVS